MKIVSTGKNQIKLRTADMGVNLENLHFIGGLIIDSFFERMSKV